MKFAKIMMAAALTVGMLFMSTGCGKNPRVKRIESATNLRQIGLGCKMYGHDNSEKYPDDLSALVIGNYLTDTKIYISPGDGRRNPADFSSFPKAENDKFPAYPFPEANLSYAYVGKGTTESFSPDCPLAFEKPDVIIQGTVNVLFVDGSVMSRDLKNKNPKTCRQILEELVNGLPENEKKIVLANADAIDQTMGK